MTVLEIVTQENPVLRAQTTAVERFDDELQQLIDDMIETMREANGVGLAAPQIGQSLRLAVVETLPETDEDGNEIPESRQLFVVANPEIVWTSRKQLDGIEGCLSIPGYLGEVTRHQAVRIQAQDRYGKKMRFGVKGWDARIFQHEIDHLDGVLYVDKLTAPENYWTEEAYEEAMREEQAAEADAQ
jgi:peptide deformylase